jgi:hypothetical protein
MFNFLKNPIKYFLKTPSGKVVGSDVFIKLDVGLYDNLYINDIKIDLTDFKAKLIEDFNKELHSKDVKTQYMA